MLDLEASARRPAVLAALFLCCGCSAGGSGSAATDPIPPGAGGAPDLGSGGAAPTSSGGEEPMFTTPDQTPREGCASAAYQGRLLPSNLLFVVDRSGSMNCNLGVATAACEESPKTADPMQPTKWSVLGGAMGAAFNRLAAVPNTSIGLSFFSNDDGCGVQSAPNVALALLSAPQVDALKNALANANPRGGTPFIGATILGFRHLHQQAQAPGNRFVVLVTDGSDSCVGKYAVEGDVVSQLLDVELPKAVSVNIRTFVIGAPGSEGARGLLSKIAFAGGTGAPGCDHASEDPVSGTACHFDMTDTEDFAADLSAALQRITGTAALTCEFDVPKDPEGAEIDLSSVNVDYYAGGDLANETSRVELYRDDTKPCDAGADGWQYTDGNAKIRICGAQCDAVKKDTSPKVIVSLGCEQRVR